MAGILDEADTFASRLAPTGGCISNVGASLLAKTPELSPQIPTKKSLACFLLFPTHTMMRFSHRRPRMSPHVCAAIAPAKLHGDHPADRFHCFLHLHCLPVHRPADCGVAGEIGR